MTCSDDETCMRLLRIDAVLLELGSTESLNATPKPVNPNPETQNPKS